MTLREEWIEAAFAAYRLGIGDDVEARLRRAFHPVPEARAGIRLPRLIRDVLSMPDGGYAVEYATEPLPFSLAHLAVGAVLLYARGAPLLRVVVGQATPGRSNVRVEGGVLTRRVQQKLLMAYKEFAVALPEHTGFRGRQR